MKRENKTSTLIIKIPSQDTEADFNACVDFKRYIRDTRRKMYTDVRTQNKH